MNGAGNSTGRPGLPHKVFSRVLLTGLLAGIVLHLIGFVIFRVVYRELPTREERPPFVRFSTPGPADAEGELAEQAALFDSSPLFIPTGWNAAQAAEGPLMETRVKVFDSFSPSINLLADLSPGQFFVSGNSGVTVPEDLIASRFWRFFSGFAERPNGVAPFPPAAVVAEVVPFASRPDAPLRLEVSLGREIPVPLSGAVEYHIRAGYGEPYNLPLLVRSSGSEEFDAATREWLMRPDVIARLPPAYSKVTIYP